MLLLLTAALLTADKLLLLYSFSVASHHFRWKLQTLALKLQRQRVVASEGELVTTCFFHCIIFSLSCAALLFPKGSQPTLKNIPVRWSFPFRG